MADPLDFDPVPRKFDRRGGWSVERQRGFIRALSESGDVEKAAHTQGLTGNGAYQLRKAMGAESFRAAWSAAIEAARQRQAGVRQRFAKEAQDAADGGGEEADSEETRLAWLADLVRKYLLKVGQEREARLAGRVVAADFYLRQLTWLEVALDLMGGGGFKVLAEFRKRDHHLGDIAETPFSRILDAARRERWAELGEPPRPQHPPRERLVEHDGFSTEPLECTWGGRPETHEEQQAAFDAEHKRQAELQLEWEALARRDYERRRDSAAES